MQQKGEETPISRFSVRAKEKQVKNSFALFLRQALIILKLVFRWELKLNKMNQHLGIIFISQWKRPQLTLFQVHCELTPSYFMK